MMNSELAYKKIIEQFLKGQLPGGKFIDGYMIQWKKDRDDNTSFDPKFYRLKDRIFTSCDCYFEKPENPWEISQEQLRAEVELLAYIWFDLYIPREGL